MNTLGGWRANWQNRPNLNSQVIASFRVDFSGSPVNTLLQELTDHIAIELATLRAQLDAAHREIQQLNEKLSAALDGTGLCIWQGEPQTGRLTVFNLQDFEHGEMAPDFEQFVAKLHPLDKDTALRNYYDHLEGRSPFYEAEYRTLRKDGGVTWLWDRGRVVERDATGKPLRIMGAHVDVTRRKAFEQQLAAQAHIDPLTGLANRRQLSERLKQEAERATRHGTGFVLAILDVDHFKRFNDTHGHEIGDRVLAELACIMEGSLREYDLCGRWGGEEFLLVLPNTSLAEAEAVIARVHLGIRRRITLQNGEALSITGSIGMTAFRQGEHFADTLRRADGALLEAKRRGRDRVLSV